LDVLIALGVGSTRNLHYFEMETTCISFLACT